MALAKDRKSANGAGSVRYYESRELWIARFTYEDPVTGVTKRSVSYGKTRTEAVAKMKTARERVEVGSPARDSKVTLANFADTWISTTLAVLPIKESTMKTYETLMKTYVIGGKIGAKGLDQLKARDVEALILSMREAGKSDSTIRQTYTVLRKLLDVAVRDQLLARNVASLVQRPAVARTEARFLSPDEVSALVEAAEGTRYHTLLYVLARTALRRGEALALKWDDVDLGAEPKIRVRGTLSRLAAGLTVTDTKTERSRRDVPLTPEAARLLTEHRQTQQKEREHLEKIGGVWEGEGYVFATEAGHPVDPRNALRAVTVAAKKAGLKDVGLHTFRHSAATSMLQAQVPLHVVSAMLGHSSVAITGDVYGHTTGDDLRDASKRLGDVLGG